MRPGSTDGVLTVLASLLVAALLFVGRYVVEHRDVVDFGPGSATTQTAGDNAPVTRDFDGRLTSSSRPEVTASRPMGSPDPQTTPAREMPSGDTFKVVGVVDGDTIDILVNRSPLRLRLNGIDTPEKGQPFGNNAKDDLAKLIAGKQVRYVVRDKDRYDRSIADVYLDNLYVNRWLVQKGLAWHYVAYSDDADLAATEAEAKAAGRGLWSDPRRVAPWNWRKLSKVERDEFR